MKRPRLRARYPSGHRRSRSSRRASTAGSCRRCRPWRLSTGRRPAADERLEQESRQVLTARRAPRRQSQDLRRAVGPRSRGQRRARAGLPARGGATGETSPAPFIGDDGKPFLQRDQTRRGAPQIPKNELVLPLRQEHNFRASCPADIGFLSNHFGAMYKGGFNPRRIDFGQQVSRLWMQTAKAKPVTVSGCASGFSTARHPRALMRRCSNCC